MRPNPPTPAEETASRIAAELELHTFYDRAPGPSTSPAALAAAGRHIDREYGETGYTIALIGGTSSRAVFRVQHFDGSRFLIVADKWENVARVPDLEEGAAAAAAAAAAA